MTNRDLIEEDLKYIWHPCTQMKDHEFLPLIPIKKGKGVYLEDFEGNRYIDAISSWWVNIFGHSNKYINKKINQQLKSLEHVILAGFSHQPAIKLAKKLVSITPKGLEKVFFADNGSSGIEVALKMAFQYFKNQGQSREYFISLSNSYHGETIGALSVSDMGLYKDVYQEILIKTIQTPSPLNQTQKEAKKAIKKLETILEQNHNKVSAVIVEPLVQCAGLMNMYHPYYLVKLRELCDKYGIFLIADEVAVGFGRTGTIFAVEQAGITPDFMVLSKGLTAGYLPLSVVLTTNKVYREFYCDYNLHKNFLHSHSYTGNAIACATALASLELFEKLNIIEKNKKKIEYIWKQVQKFKELSNVKEVRQTGMICAIELKGYEAKERIGLQVYQYGLKNGVLLRPLGNVIYFMPPYVIKKKEMALMINVAYDAIKRLIK
jgi:adenosylmethionine-8-amino-7-oxononanoate aminotransferase